MSTIYDLRMRPVASAAGASTSEHLAEPLVTALLPVKDYHERYLHKALGSVVGQTSPAWEMIVIGEEGGREALATVLERYLLDPRIELIANEAPRVRRRVQHGDGARAHAVRGHWRTSFTRRGW
jgi:hypothetical protein